MRRLKTLLIVLILAFAFTAHGATLFNYPKFRGTTSTGKALSGGLLYTYAPGTTTAKATYKDSAKAASNTNPVVLDSNGEATVYLDGLYKMVLKNSAGVTQWTMDNVSGIGTSVVDYATISDYGTDIGTAVTAIGATPMTLIIDKATTCTGNVTVPSTLKLQVEKAGVITVSAGKTLTINGPFDAGLYQVFAGTGSVTLSSVLGIYPQWFGASPSATAATNVTAFQAAIESSNNAAVTHTTTFVIDGSAPPIIVPMGEYDLNDTLTIYNYTKIYADGQVVLHGTDLTKDIIYSLTPYHNEFNGITFVGGKSHISLQNGVNGSSGKEGALTKITNCYFSTSSDYSLEFTRNDTGGGWQIIVDKSEFFHNAQMLYSYEIDSISINDSWLEPSKTYTADDVAQIYTYYSRMYINNLLCAPDGFTTNTTNRWIDFYGEELVITKSRFGAESGGGMPVVYNFTNALSNTTAPYINTEKGGAIVIKDSMTACYAAGGTDGGAIVLKSGLPNLIVFENNSYLVNTLPVINTASMTGAVSLTTYMATIDAAKTYQPVFNIQIKGGAEYSNTITGSATDDDLLLPYMTVNQTWPAGSSSYYYEPAGNYNAIGNLHTNVITTSKLYGKRYAETSISPAAPNDTISVIDTGETALDASAYLVTIIANPNTGGSSTYRDSIVGIITTHTITAGTITSAWTPIVAPKAIGGYTLTVTPSIDAQGHIVISVGGFSAGFAGHYETVRMVRLSSDYWTP